MSDWQLDRLPGDVRQEAENTAQRDGLPLHRWLGKLIREACADEGIPPLREVSPNLGKEPEDNGRRSRSAPARPPVDPIRIPAFPRFPDRAVDAAPGNGFGRPNFHDGGAAAARPSETFGANEPPRDAEAPALEPPRHVEAARPAPRRFSDPVRMPEPRVAEALHVVEPRPAAPPRQARAATPIARETAARIPPATVPRAAETAAPSPAALWARAASAPSPLSSLSTAAPPAAPSPGSSLSTAPESWAAKRARPPAASRYAVPRASAAEARRPEPPRQMPAPPMPVPAMSAPAVPTPAEPIAAFANLGSTDERVAALAKLVQGLRRNELSPVGEARLFLRLMTEHMASIGDITVATGRTKDQVARSLRLLGLSDRLRDLIDRGALSRDQAFALLDTQEPDSRGPTSSPDSGQRTP